MSLLEGVMATAPRGPEQEAATRYACGRAEVIGEGLQRMKLFGAVVVGGRRGHTMPRLLTERRLPKSSACIRVPQLEAMK